MRIRKPQTTAMIYKSGNIVCTGAKRSVFSVHSLLDRRQDGVWTSSLCPVCVSEEQSRIAARRFARIVQKLGFPVRFLHFRIQNLVASCKIFPISLEQLVLVHSQHCRSGDTSCGYVHLNHSAADGLKIPVIKKVILSICFVKSLHFPLNTSAGSEQNTAGGCTNIDK